MQYKPQRTIGIFDQQEAIDLMSEMGNALEKLSKVIDFKMFRHLLEENLAPKVRKTNASARPFDYVMMFKIMILQRLFGLSDKQTQYQIIDRTSFKTFLGLATGDKVPDEKSIWLFREKITDAGIVEELFNLFHNYLLENNLIVNEGKMVDASFTTAPRQRNTKEENQKIKEGKGDELCDEKPAKKRQKDVDARWTKKGNENFYGYKNSVLVDAKSKLIENWHVMTANTHDSQALEHHLSNKYQGEDFYGDSAYTGVEQEKIIAESEMKNLVCEKGYKSNPLTDKQKESNREKSKVRARVEHVFGFMEQSMHGLSLKSIGLKRAKGIIGLINLTYNLFRYKQIIRLNIILT